MALAPDGEAAKTRKFSALDWVRILFAVGVLTLGPSLLFESFLGQVHAYEHTGWLARLLLTVPATLVCGLVTSPPVWLICRGSAIYPLAVMFAVIYTPVNGFMLVGALNVALDGAPGRVVTVPYVRQEDRHKGPNRDIFTSWHDPSSTISLPATLLRQEQRVPGAPVSVIVHGGWLGLEWVSRAEVPR